MKKSLLFHFTICFTLTLITFGCKRNNAKYVEFKIKNEDKKNTIYTISKNNVKYISLKSENIHGLFTEIAVVDKLLVCGNLRSRKLVNIYSLDNGKLLNELIGRGELQKEGLSVSNIFISNNFSWIYDITQSKFFKIDLRNKKKDSLKTTEIDLAKNLKNIINPTIINDTLLLATTYSRDDFRYLYASPQKILKKIGQLPNIKNSEYIIDVKQTKFPNRAFTFKAISVKHPTQNKIAIFYSKADRIEFYSNDKLIKTTQSEDRFSPIMQVAKVEEGGFSVEDCEKTKYAHLSTSYTEKYIYSLYSGNNETTSNKILVFNWNGQLIKEILTDRKVCKIFVDAKNNILYCYEIQGNGIYSANLNF